MNSNYTRLEVMHTIGQSMDELLSKYLKPIDGNWQPTDFLPDPASPDFNDEVKELQALAQDIDYDLFVVLIGNTMTEEALPTYESWLMAVDGITQEGKNGWAQWIRSWTAEENRHGDLLNKYLYLSARVDMRAIEISTQYLISDGLDINTGTDPYRNFVYTSFQELATNISHRRIASIAKKTSNHKLAKMCGVIAADEARHATAYINFVERIFEMDPNEMMLAFQDMMQKKIVMPAYCMREEGMKVGELWSHFSDAAQRATVYTTQDYIDIMRSLIVDWKIDSMTNLNSSGEKARDYIMKLPARMERVSERLKIPERSHEFKWMGGQSTF